MVVREDGDEEFGRGNGASGDDENWEIEKILDMRQRAGAPHGLGRPLMSPLNHKCRRRRGA